MVGLSRNVLGRYPHEFSGGQRQRIGIAKALSLNPKFIVCDEPVSALDVSIQAQILNLLKSLQKELHLTLLFVGHGLGAVNYVSDRIAVMYLGKIVETGETKEIFNHPVHPYTKALLNAVPVPDPKEREKARSLLEGEIGDSTNPPGRLPFSSKMPLRHGNLRAEGAGAFGGAAGLRTRSRLPYRWKNYSGTEIGGPELGKYIIKRILIAIPVLIGITVIDYAIMCMAGSPLEMLQGPRVSEAAVEARKIALGLDKPFYIQYFVWLGQLLHGNMGYSIKSYQPVSDMIGSHLGPTLLLMGVSLLVSLLMAVPAGIYSAVHQYSKGDYAVVTFSFLGSSIPGFFLSLLLIYVFTVKLGWLPSSGMTTLGTEGGFRMLQGTW